MNIDLAINRQRLERPPPFYGLFQCTLFVINLFSARELVKDFNKFTDEELKIQKDGYKANQLEWSIDSIKSQGYVRPGINIFHPSETSLLTLLPEQKTISYPMRRDSEALNKSVLDLLRSQSVTATNTVDNKEKLDKTANSTISSIKP